VAPDPGDYLAIEAIVLDMDNGGRSGVRFFFIGEKTDLQDISDTEDEASVLQKEREAGPREIPYRAGTLITLKIVKLNCLSRIAKLG
jgi:hypothetical protein